MNWDELENAYESQRGSVAQIITTGSIIFLTRFSAHEILSLAVIIMTKHTQGTWTAEHDADGDFGIFWGNTHICTTVSDTTEDEANAHLIAASPDMLTALKAAIAFIGETQEYKTGHTGAASIVTQGQGAIAKAEGK